LVEGPSEVNRRVLAKTVAWRALAAACAADSECGSGFCVDGVCCNQACGGTVLDDCQACSAAAGASANGVCTQLSATHCDDHDACTRTDTCSAGVCQGGDPVTCGAPAACHAPGVCNPATGACQRALTNGLACDDANRCTTGDVCAGGTCGGTPITCTPGECQQASACSPSSGACEAALMVDGSLCSVGTCLAGECTPNPTTSPGDDTKPCGCSGGGGALGLLGLLVLAGLLRRPATRERSPTEA
jgi:uncharacterized protein (TIGR03382 family)